MTRKSDQDSGSESPEEPESEEESSEDEEDEPQPTVRSYAALMQSFATESAPQVKRRKLTHNEEPKASEALEEETSKANDKDHVEEAEEGPETAIDGLLEDDDEEDISDPFETHFTDPDKNELSNRLEFLEKNEWVPQQAMLPKIGRALSLTPGKGSLETVSPTVAQRTGELKLKQKLAHIIEKQIPSFDALEKHVAPLMFNYQDILFCERDTGNAESLRRLACLHAVNHVFK